MRLMIHTSLFSPKRFLVSLLLVLVIYLLLLPSQVNFIQDQSKEVILIASCKDKNNQLNRALDSWLLLNPAKIILVDWSSNKSYTSTVSVQSRNLIFIRVDDQDEFISSWAYNLAVEIAVQYSNQNTWILKTDCGTWIHSSFINLHGIKNNSIVYTQHLDDGSVSSVLFLSLKKFLNIGGIHF